MNKTFLFMENLRNVNIKELINTYPETYDIFKSYNFDCLKCHGKCLIKEVVDMEQLDMEQEIEMFTRLIERIKKE